MFYVVIGPFLDIFEQLLLEQRLVASLRRISLLEYQECLAVLCSKQIKPFSITDHTMIQKQTACNVVSCPDIHPVFCVEAFHGIFPVRT
jgi:hypothetical protein